MIAKLVVAGIVGVVMLSALAGLIDPSSSNKTASAAKEPAITVMETPQAPAGAPEAPTPTPVIENRANCDQIRGTSYNSPNERQWFLANCLGR